MKHGKLYDMVGLQKISSFASALRCIAKSVIGKVKSTEFEKQLQRK